MHKKKRNLSIHPFIGGDTGEGDTIAQMLGTELTKLGNFQIVPHSDTDVIDANEGENTRYVILGHLQNISDTKIISASIIDVKTFHQLGGWLL